MANERPNVNRAGQVVLKLKTVFCDGTTHLMMSPLEFMQRLAALVLRSRLHLIRFRGAPARMSWPRLLTIGPELHLTNRPDQTRLEIIRRS